ncbi:MAG TPA: NAD+ synthase [Candidatus Bathyarchaeia archaeon]|nr:NAD+ synthase [Candidatus Bathyarchaeia archaeon]
MMLTKQVLKLDLQTTTVRLERFIKDYVQKVGAKGIVLALSGGIDSSTIAALSAMSIGGPSVLALYMPERETGEELDFKHSKMLAKKFGFVLERLDITGILEAYYKAIQAFDPKDLVSKGNIKARARAICVYYHANHQNRIVVGPSDKSETMMGYFTKWGDVAADISPLMDLYKTQVRQLAAYIGVPAEIVAKPSTPKLWPEQLAEEELGIKYETLDLILFGLENFMSAEEIAKQLNLSPKRVEDIKTRWLSMEHKRRAPLTMKMQYRTVGADFRLPYTQPDQRKRTERKRG